MIGSHNRKGSRSSYLHIFHGKMLNMTDLVEKKVSKQNLFSLIMVMILGMKDQLEVQAKPTAHSQHLAQLLLK